MLSLLWRRPDEILTIIPHNTQWPSGPTGNSWWLRDGERNECARRFWKVRMPEVVISFVAVPHRNGGTQRYHWHTCLWHWKRFLSWKVTEGLLPRKQCTISVLFQVTAGLRSEFYVHSSTNKIHRYIEISLYTLTTYMFRTTVGSSSG